MTVYELILYSRMTKNEQILIAGNSNKIIFLNL